MDTTKPTSPPPLLFLTKPLPEDILTIPFILHGSMLSPGSRHTPSGDFIDGTPDAHQDIFNVLTEGSLLEQLAEASSSKERKDIIAIMETTWPHLINETFIRKLIEVDTPLFLQEFLDPESPISQLSPDLHRPIVRAMVQTGQSHFLSYIFDELTGIRIEEHLAFAQTIIQGNQWDAIFENHLFKKLSGISEIDHLALVENIIDHWGEENVPRLLSRFPGVPSTAHLSLAKRIIAAGAAWECMKYFEKFTGIGPEDHQEVVRALFEQGAHAEVAYRRNKLTGVDHSHDFDLAKDIIYHGDTEAFNFRAVAFSGLEPKLTQHAYLPVSEALILEDHQALTSSHEQQLIALTALHPDRTVPETRRFFMIWAEIFGYEKMWTYLQRPNVSRSHQLQDFQKSIDLLQRSGLKPNIFFNNILIQITKDNATYGQGNTSYDQYYKILETLPHLDEINPWGNAKKYPEILPLQEFLTEHTTLTKALSSWKTLIKFYEILQLVQQHDLLDTLASLTQTQPQLAAYVHTLMFHPGVDMRTVSEFLEEPEKFLDRDDDRIVELHRTKKPSIYSKLHLDLTPTQVRDALVDGTMDRIAARTPLEIQYEIADALVYDTLSTPDLLKRAVWTRSQQIPGEAQQPNKLFSELKTLCKPRHKQLIKIISWEETLSADQDAQIRALALNIQTGLPATQTEQYRVQIHRKSDPMGAVAGNDTASCMPFWSGKNNVYLRNPLCAIMTVQRQNTKGLRRTVAQSVLTRDKNIGINIADFVKKPPKHPLIPYEELVGSGILQQWDLDVIACDNIEISENYKKYPHKDDHLKLLYSDFFAEYLKKYGQSDHLDPRQFIIGTQSRDGLDGLRQIPNTYWPRTPVAYSDNTMATTFALTPHEQHERMASKILHTPEPQAYPGMYQKFSAPELSSLTYLDTLEAAYLEATSDKVEHGSMVIELNHMSGFLITPLIADAQRNFPNLSIKYTDTSWKMLGHMIAYETNYNNREIIHMRSLAALHSDPKVEDALIRGFAELYKGLYRNKQRHPTVVFSVIIGETKTDEIWEKLIDAIGDPGFKLLPRNLD